MGYLQSEAEVKEDLIATAISINLERRWSQTLLSEEWRKEKQ